MGCHKSRQNIQSLRSMRLAVAASVLCVFAAAFDNSCLLQHNLSPPTKDAPTTFLSECAKWVIETTDLVWNTKPHVNATLEKYFHKDFQSHTSFGRVYQGLDTLKEVVASTQRAFPDLKIHISDSYCVGNDIDGYKTIMPDVLTGTNAGPSSYGPATHRRVTYSGLAITYVQRVDNEWKYVAEWVLHDELSLVSQLGLQPAIPNTTSSPNRNCAINTPGWGWRPALEAATAPAQVMPTNVVEAMEGDGLPLSKALIKAMDSIISNHIDCFDWNSWSKAMDPFWTLDFTYDTNWTPFPGVLGNSTGLRQWFDHEHVKWNVAFPNCTFNQLIFAGEELTATTTTYASGLFKNDLAGIPATKRPVTVRIFDFYRIDPVQQK